MIISKIKNTCRQNWWFVVLLVLALLVLLVPMAIFGYYTSVGWPQPKYITHGSLAFTMVGDVMFNCSLASLTITPLVLFASGVIIAVRQHKLAVLAWIFGLILLELFIAMGDMFLTIVAHG